jgi:choline dehydrogenase-like flavoprotein
LPFIDANQRLLDCEWSRYDVTIIGAGAVGILLAVKLASYGKRVLIIESGHFEPDDDRQALNEIEEIGKPLGNARWVRKRIIGGTTTAWGGQSLPFSPIDFSPREWVDHSGWPLTYDSLRQYYAIANEFMGIDTLNYDSDITRLFNLQPLKFDPDVVYFHYSKWAKEPNFFKLYGRQLSARTTILYNCQLLRIDLADKSRVEAIQVGNFQGDSVQVAVLDLVLAAGGIETTRILLLNDHQMRGGVGNHSGWLGRMFMEHPSITAGIIETSDMHRLQSSLATRYVRRRRYGTRMSASMLWQRRNQMLNVSASILWLYESEGAGPLAELRAFLRRPTLDSLPNLARNSGLLARGLWALMTEGFPYKPGAQATLTITAEQNPTWDSYIGLSNRVDRFGCRLALLNWRVSSKAWLTIVSFASKLSSEIERLQLGRVSLFDHLRIDEPDWERHLSDVNHHMGGARMSAHAIDGVVDEHLRVWGVRNLYVCSAAVFPTSSHSNPTLTLLALGARLAERLGTAEL